VPFVHVADLIHRSLPRDTDINGQSSLPGPVTYDAKIVSSSSNDWTSYATCSNDSASDDDRKVTVRLGLECEEICLCVTTYSLCVRNRGKRK